MALLTDSYQKLGNFLKNISGGWSEAEAARKRTDSLA